MTKLIAIKHAYVNLFIAIKDLAEKEGKLYIFERNWLGDNSPINWNAFRRMFQKDDTKGQLRGGIL